MDFSQSFFVICFANFGWGAATPQFLAGGAKPTQDPPPERSSAAFDHGGQTEPPRSNDFFFGAADDTCAAQTSGQTSGRTPGVVWLALTSLNKRTYDLRGSRIYMHTESRVNFTKFFEFGIEIGIGIGIEVGMT